MPTSLVPSVELAVGTMLPNEVLLDTLHFVDYKTLVHAKLAGARLRGIVTVTFYFGYISCVEPSTKKSCFAIHLGGPRTFAAACREVAETIGPHAVSVLDFPRGSWNVAGVGTIFEAAPPLRYAEEVRVRAIANHARTSGRIGCASDLHVHSAAFMRNFRGLKTLRLWLDYDLFRLFDWTFLGQESARDLRLIRVSDTTSTWHEQADPLVEELVRYCLTIPRTLGGEPLELEFPGQSIRASFARRIIELLKDSRRELTFRMYMDDALMLAGADYAVHVVDRKTTRYVSESSGIVVEVYRRHRPEHRQADNRVNKRANGTVLRILTDLTSRLVLSSNCTKYWSSLN